VEGGDRTTRSHGASLLAGSPVATDSQKIGEEQSRTQQTLRPTRASDLAESHEKVDLEAAVPQRESAGVSALTHGLVDIRRQTS